MVHNQCIKADIKRSGIRIVYSVRNKFCIYSTSSGGCPRMPILFKIEAFSKNKHSHMFDIGDITNTLVISQNVLAKILIIPIH